MFKKWGMRVGVAVMVVTPLLVFATTQAVILSVLMVFAIWKNSEKGARRFENFLGKLLRV